MQDPEDKGSRYRLGMFIAIAAIVVPGWFLLGWLGDNGVGNLFRGLLGLDTPQPRYTRTVTATPTEASPPLVIVDSTATTMPAPTSPPEHTPAAAPTDTPQAPTPTQLPPPPPAPTAIPTTPPPPPTATPVPPPTATPLPPPTATPTRVVALGYGTAIPAYGGAAVMRAQPTTDAAQMGSIPLGETVLVFRIVEGEAIDPVESRWWHVEYEGVAGYVYYKLIELD